MNRTRLKAILKLVLFGVGIIVGVVFLVTRTHAGHVSESIVLGEPSLTVKWEMQKRFGDKRPDGIMDFHWSESTRSYDADYVNPHGWKVDFDACSPNMPVGTNFTWRLDGVALPNANPSSCTFTHEFTKQGSYIVNVAGSAPDNTTAVGQIVVTIKDLLIVSLGDSFASGQGNPDLDRHDPAPARWVDSVCARSEHSGPAQAAVTIEENDKHTSVTFLSFACSGAEINAGILGDQQKGKVKVKPQIEELQKALSGRPIDALLISIGGNDIGFSTLVALCIIDFNCDRRSHTLNKLTSGLNALDGNYQKLSDKIAQRLTVSKVFITEYPDLVRDQNGVFCDGEPKSDHFLKKLDAKEAEWASTSVIGGLNQKVEKAARDHGWIYVAGIATQFTKHGYCANPDPWVRTFVEAKRVQGLDAKCELSSILHSLGTVRDCLISSGAVHPTKEGHTAYATSLLAAVKKEGVITATDSTPISGN